MFFWFIIVTKIIALKNNIASIEHSGAQHSAGTFCVGFLFSSSQPSYDVATVTTSIFQMKNWGSEVKLLRPDHGRVGLNLT